MTQPLYDIYFTGKLVAGADIKAAKANLAQLFKSNVDSISKLFNGKPQLLKRGVDKAGALKYKAALHKAGLLVAFKAHQAEQTIKQTEDSVTTPAVAENKTTATAETAQTNFTLAPVGCDVLNDDEKQTIEPCDIDTSNIKLVSAFFEPETNQKAPPPAPDVSHISVAQAGEDLLIERPQEPPELKFDLDDISIAPVGADLEQLQDDLPQVIPNTNGISLAPPGSDLMPGGGKKWKPRPPNTDHITIAEND